MGTARKARELPETGRTVITIPNTKVEMEGLTPPHDLAPKERPYRFPADQVQDVAMALRLGMNVMLTGPTGCGKTSLPVALASVLGRPLVRFNCDGETRVSNLRGMMKPAAVDGVLSLIFSAGDLAIAMREGYWVVLDEIDAALPSVLFVLQPVLEENRRSLHLPETGETVQAAADFAIFGTGNTVGYRASARARHAGTQMLNTAFLDRFGMVIDCQYPDRLEEIERVKVNVPDCPEEFVDGVCRVASELRQDEHFRTDFSTRRCVQWARLIQAYEGDVLRAAELAVVRKLENATDAKVAREVIRRIFGYEGDR